jgi:hypothetical protein
LRLQHVVLSRGELIKYSDLTEASDIAPRPNDDVLSRTNAVPAAGVWFRFFAISNLFFVTLIRRFTAAITFPKYAHF